MLSLVLWVLKKKMPSSSESNSESSTDTSSSSGESETSSDSGDENVSWSVFVGVISVILFSETPKRPKTSRSNSAGEESDEDKTQRMLNSSNKRKCLNFYSESVLLRAEASIVPKGFFSKQMVFSDFEIRHSENENQRNCRRRGACRQSEFCLKKILLSVFWNSCTFKQPWERKNGTGDGPKPPSKKRQQQAEGVNEPSPVVDLETKSPEKKRNVRKKCFFWSQKLLFYVKKSLFSERRTRRASSTYARVGVGHSRTRSSFEDIGRD